MMLRSFEVGAFALLAMPLIVGCSDPVAPPAQGAMSIHITSPTSPPAGRKCTVPSHTAIISGCDSGGKCYPPTTTTKGRVVVDGEGAAVTCQVKGGGSKFTFSGQMAKGNVTFAVFGEVNSGAGTARITQFDPDSNDTLRSAQDAQCQVIANEDNLGVATGRIWARFECPELEGGDPALFCKAASDSVFVLENCDE